MNRPSDERPAYACVYCGADCDMPEPAHGPDCPFVTGLYPVREQDVRCPGGCGCVIGMRCCECDAEFAVGDIYALTELAAEVETTVGPAQLSQTVCLGCAAMGVVTR